MYAYRLLRLKANDRYQFREVFPVLCPKVGEDDQREFDEDVCLLRSVDRVPY